MASENRTFTFRFGERVVIGNVDNLNSELESCVGSENIQHIVFDLENVRICDSYGINFLLQFQRKAEKSQKELILYRPGALFRDILKNSGLSHIFTIVDNLEEQSTG